MSIEIRKAGLLTLLVAGERRGFRQLGIGPGGAMDSFAMRVANFLVGNDASAAVLEMHPPLPEIIFQKITMISLTGTDFEAIVNEEKLPLWKPVVIRENTRLQFKSKPSGRAYLAASGGWKAETWLSSQSTHLGVQAGGYFGRALKKDDVLEGNNKEHLGHETKIFPWGISSVELDKVYSPKTVIRCVPGTEFDWLSDHGKKTFESAPFTITGKSNRMGFRLVGEPISMIHQIELVSSPVDFGTVQRLPDGNLIILMADHQTTGGYPRIASVIKADLPKLTQLGPSDNITFMMIGLAEAERLFLSREKILAEIKAGCREQLNKYLAK